MGSTVRQQAVPFAFNPCRLKPFTVGRVSGFEANPKSGETHKIISARTATSLNADFVLLGAEATPAQSTWEALERGDGHWMHPRPISQAGLSAYDTTGARRPIKMQ